MTDKQPFFVEKVLADELDQMAARRSALVQEADLDERTGPSGYERAHRMRPLGVGLSGGGIRSATFNLGLLQGLAQCGLTPHIDYLSTVSGGGYIGTWLHGVILRKHGGDPRAAAETLSPRHNPIPGDPDKDPVSFLRKYSNYLAPALGLFSGDLWVIGGIWFRNMFLNLLILVPFLAAALVSAVLLGLVEQHASGQPDVRTFNWMMGALLMLVAVLTARVNVRFAAQREFGGEPAPPRRWTTPVCTGALLLASFMLACSHALPALGKPSTYFALSGLVALFWLFQKGNGFSDCYWNRHRKSLAWRTLLALHYVWIPLVCASMTTGLLLALSWLFEHWDVRHSNAGMDGWMLVAWGPPLLIQVWIMGVSLHVGLMGSDMPDGAREWFARIGAQLGVASVAWLAWFGLAVFGPYSMALLALAFSKTTLSAIGGWIAMTVGGVLAGKSGKSDGKTAGAGVGKTALELVVKIAPTVFLIGFLLLIAFGIHAAVIGLAHWQGVPMEAQPKVPSKAPAWLAGPVWDFQSHYWPALDHVNWAKRFDDPASPWIPACSLVTLALLAGLALVTTVVSSRVNINEFTLHHFYKNRLVRCYLGAGMGARRRPNPLTGFDPEDDLPLAKLTVKPQTPLREGEKPYLGPYPILNSVLNLNRGSELAKQERKGSSFVFTPLYSGFDPPHSARDTEERSRPNSSIREEGYRPTRGYAYPPAGLGIGTAMAISGAAASPNSGYSTSASMAFMLTIFDARLGWWLGNPRMEAPSSRPGPVFALWYLLKELFAQTDARTNYLNLSDGGFFDNLGLYELVRRRCRYIIIGDAEQDGGYTFGSLGDAIRKCRADFGVEIDVDPGRIRPVDGFSQTHCVVGRIKYPEKEAGAAATFTGEDGPGPEKASGWLIYFKAGLTGDEPEDVIEYRANHGDFPHQTTANQFFTESQFESYRRLGLHAVETVFENASAEQGMLKLFQDLARQWYPPSDIGEGVATRHAEAYSALLRRITETPGLEFMDTRLFSGSGQGAPRPLPAEDSPEYRRAFYACLDLIQLMENVYTDLHFYNAADRFNPNNGGWMSTFERWAKQDIFMRTWSVAKPTYNQLFQEFFNNLI